MTPPWLECDPPESADDLPQFLLHPDSDGFFWYGLAMIPGLDVLPVQAHGKGAQADQQEAH
jgi:hypothetical protein